MNRTIRQFRKYINNDDKFDFEIRYIFEKLYNKILLNEEEKKKIRKSIKNAFENEDLSSLILSVLNDQIQKLDYEHERIIKLSQNNNSIILEEKNGINIINNDNNLKYIDLAELNEKIKKAESIIINNQVFPYMSPLTIDRTNMDEKIKIHMKYEYFSSIFNMNFFKILRRILKDGYNVIDFCGGDGYISIILAFFFPKVNFYLIDIDESSLESAKDNLYMLNIKNYNIICGDIHEIIVPKFHLAIGNNTCSNLPDTILKKAIENNAPFILNPCCHDEKIDSIEFPKSNFFMNLGIKKNEWEYIKNNFRYDSFNISTLIDKDRIQYAKENNYAVFMLNYPTNMFVGIPSNICGKNDFENNDPYFDDINNDLTLNFNDTSSLNNTDNIEYFGLNKKIYSNVDCVDFEKLDEMKNKEVWVRGRMENISYNGDYNFVIKLRNKNKHINILFDKSHLFDQGYKKEIVTELIKWVNRIPLESILYMKIIIDQDKNNNNMLIRGKKIYLLEINTSFDQDIKKFMIPQDIIYEKKKTLEDIQEQIENLGRLLYNNENAELDGKTKDEIYNEFIKLRMKSDDIIYKYRTISSCDYMNKILNARTPSGNGVFTIKSQIIKLCRKYLDENNFIEMSLYKPLIYRENYINHLIYTDFEKIYDFDSRRSYKLNVEMVINRNYNESMLLCYNLVAQILKILDDLDENIKKMMETKYNVRKIKYDENILKIDYSNNDGRMFDPEFEKSNPTGKEIVEHILSYIKKYGDNELFIIDKIPNRISHYLNIKNSYYSNTYYVCIKEKIIAEGGERITETSKIFDNKDKNVAKESTTEGKRLSKIKKNINERYKDNLYNLSCYPYAGFSINIDKIIASYFDINNMGKYDIFS